jgi:urea carboxylase
LSCNHKIRLKRWSFDTACAVEIAQDRAIEHLTPLEEITPVPLTKPGHEVSECPDHELSECPDHELSKCIVASLPENTLRPCVTYRQAGDKYILIEYGKNILDLRLRLRIHALMEALKGSPIKGVIELSPGVRSLQINYDSRIIHQRALIALLLNIEETLGDIHAMKVLSRIVYLPMAFEDSATLEAVVRYRQSVRNSAPWLPSNTEFMRRINGLDSIQQVKDIVFETSYMVLGLGDVYLGAPCAVPVDPRHRLLTSKYNPARTYTAEGTVGIGGVYMYLRNGFTRRISISRPYITHLE